MKRKLLSSTGLILGCSLIAACGGGGGGSSSPENGILNLGITDAPVDEAEHVLVEFSGVRLKPVDGEWIDFDLDGESGSCINWPDLDNPQPDASQPTIRCIDLLALHGGASELILDGVVLPAGRYEAIRLLVNAERGTPDSIFVDKSMQEHSLYIPSGAQSGLKLNSPFSIGANGENDFIIDFDLRKSVNKPQGHPDYQLKPSLKLIENSRTGTAIFGTVAQSLLQDDCGDDDPHIGNIVYVFEGDLTEEATLPDYNSVAGTGPYTTALVNWNDDLNDYAYRAAFLPEGTYTVAFTCQGELDELDTVDEIHFHRESTPISSPVNVVTGSEYEANFAPATE